MNLKALELGNQKATLRGGLVCAAISAGIHFELPVKQRALEAVELADAALEAMAAHLHVFSNTGDAAMCLECGQRVEDSKPETDPQKVYVVIDRLGGGEEVAVATMRTLDEAKALVVERLNRRVHWAEHDKLWDPVGGSRYSIVERPHEPQKVYVLSALNIDRGLHCVIAVKTSLDAAKNLAQMRFGSPLTWTERSGHGAMWVDRDQNYTVEEFEVVP